MQTTTAPLPPVVLPIAESGQAAGRTRGDDVVARVRSTCAMHEIDARGLALLLRSADGFERYPRTRLDEIAQTVLDGQQPDLAPETLRAVAAAIEESTGHAIPAAGLMSRRTAMARRVADLVGAVLAVICGYMVVGGLVTGQSDLLHSGPSAVAAFAAVLALLALFEALHVSVVQLKTSDLAELASTYPRAHALQRRFRTDIGTQRFLAGRQMVVIVTVFFVAGLSSFRSMEVLPFTSVALPAALRPLIELGVPGALFTLWVGQLVPQFVATRSPLALMDRPVVTWAFRLAMALEAIGFARPGFWLSGRGKPTEAIPTSATLRWSQAACETDGVGIVAMNRSWTVSRDHSRLDATTTTAFFAETRESHSDRSLMLPAPATELSVGDSLVRDGSANPGLLQTGCNEERMPSGDRRLHKTAVPRIGSFLRGDILRTGLEAEFEGDVGRDVVLVDRPVRLLLFSVAITEGAEHVPSARLVAYQVGDGTTDVVADLETIVLAPRQRSDGTVLFEHAVSFPAPGTLYSLDWEALYR